MNRRLDSHLIQNKLADLSASQEDIQNLSALFIRFYSDAEHIINIWLKRFQEATAKKRLTYMYLCNDIIQKCIHSNGGMIYKQIFKRILPEVSKLISETPIKVKIERIYGIWCERNIYDHVFTDELVDILNNKQRECKPLKTDSELPDFEVGILMSNLDKFESLSNEVEVKRRKLMNCSSDASEIDDIIPKVKDRITGNAYRDEFEESYVCMQDYVEVLEKDIDHRVNLIDSLHSAQKYFNDQYKDARIILSAYKNFTRRVKKQDHRVQIQLRDILRRKVAELNCEASTPTQQVAGDTTPPSCGEEPPKISSRSPRTDESKTSHTIEDYVPPQGAFYQPPLPPPLPCDKIQPPDEMTANKEGDDDMDLSDGESPIMVPPDSPIISPNSSLDVDVLEAMISGNTPIKSFLEANTAQNGATADSIASPRLDTSATSLATKPCKPMAPPSMPDILRTSTTPNTPPSMPHLSQPRPSLDPRTRHSIASRNIPNAPMLITNQAYPSSVARNSIESMDSHSIGDISPARTMSPVDMNIIMGHIIQKHSSLPNLDCNRGHMNNMSSNRRNIDNMGDNRGNMNNMGDNRGNMNAMGDNRGNINAMGDNRGNMNAMGDIRGTMNAMGDIRGNMNTVGDNRGNMNTVGDNRGNMNTMRDNMGNMNSMGDTSRNMNTIRDNSRNMNAMGDNFRNNVGLGDNRNLNNNFGSNYNDGYNRVVAMEKGDIDHRPGRDQFIASSSCGGYKMSTGPTTDHMNNMYSQLAAENRYQKEKMAGGGRNLRVYPTSGVQMYTPSEHIPPFTNPNPQKTYRPGFNSNTNNY